MRAQNARTGPLAGLRPPVSALALALALSACTDDVLTAPATSSHDAILEPARSASDSSGVGGHRIMLSNRFAYVWADQASPLLGVWYSPSPSYSENALGLANQVRRTTVGHYEVSFAGMLHPNASTEKVTLIATAYGTTSNRCVVQKWAHAHSSALVATVVCVNPAGVATDSRFTLLFVGNGSLGGRHGFARGNQPHAASYAPNPRWSHSSGPGPVQASRSGIGAYAMNLTLPRPIGGLPENVFVTTIGSPNNHCQAAFWGGSAIGVKCYSRFAGAPADAQYDVLLVEGGRTNRRLGFAFADQPTSSDYAPSALYRRNSAGGQINIKRLAQGQYAVVFDGLQRPAGRTEHVQVTAFQGGFVFCNVVSWADTFTGMEVIVECRSQTGTLVDNRFTILLIE